MMTPAKKKKGKKATEPKPEVLVVSNQPVNVRQVTVEQHKSKVWDTLATVRRSLWFGFWVGVGLMPIGSHIVSQFYCGVGDKLRCTPIEFPAWMEAGGIIVALIFANAAKDVVSKSARQLAEAAKGWLPWAKKESEPSPPPGS